MSRLNLLDCEKPIHARVYLRHTLSEVMREIHKEKGLTLAIAVRSALWDWAKRNHPECVQAVVTRESAQSLERLSAHSSPSVVSRVLQSQEARLNDWRR